MAKVFSGSHHTEAGNTNLPHNNREEEEIMKKRNKHIDQDKIKENVYIIQQPIEEAYEDIFYDALEEYNKRQRRSDRKIDNYYEHVKNSKTTYTQRESIVQVGNYDDIRSGRLDPELAKEILVEYAEGFQERNPNLILYNAVIHMDEATPHLHANFIPVGRDYQRGMDKQVAFNRALSQQNPEFDQSRPFDDWRQQEVDVLTEIMRSRGIERAELEPTDHVPISQFKEYKERHDKLDEKDANLTKFSKLLNSKVSEVNKVVSEVNKAKLEVKAEKEANQAESSRLEALKTELETVGSEQAAKDDELASMRLKMDDRAIVLANGEKSVEDAQESLRGSQGAFDEYVENEKEELDNTRTKLYNTSKKLDNTRVELDKYADTIKSDTEALNSSRLDFDEYVELMQEQMSEEAKKLVSEKTGVLELMGQLKTMTKDQLKAVITTATDKIDTFTREIEDLNKLSEEDSQQL